MSVYGFFQPSILGMEAQGHSLSAIANNITNVHTGGFKRTDVQFATVLSNSISSQPGSADAAPSGTSNADFGGVLPKDYARISLQGEIQPTDRKLDAAINGNGLFVLNSKVDGSGQSLYGRDGRFNVTSVADRGALAVSEGYLVDKNGLYVQGWTPEKDGSFPTDAGSLKSMRVDPLAFGNVGTPTTQASLSLNLPATAAPGEMETHSIDVFDSVGNRQDLRLHFSRSTEPNTWGFEVVGAPDSQVSIDGAPAAGPMVFGANGYLESPATYNVGITHADGATSDFAFDVSGFTQFGDTFTALDYNRDGFLASELESVEFDEGGNVIGVFESGMTRPIYKLALAEFANVDGLDERNGNVYTASETSGQAEIGSPGAGRGSIMPAAHELSNVDLAQEFSRMITTQNAYNASATSFRTADEMTEIARDLKR